MCTIKYFTIRRIILEQQPQCGNITILALTLSKKMTHNGMLAKQTTAKSKYTTFMSTDFLVIIAFKDFILYGQFKSIRSVSPV